MNSPQAHRLSAWLKEAGFEHVPAIHDNLTVPVLVEKAVSHNEGVLSAGGALVTRTGKFTGRAAQDKFVVRDQETQSVVDWDANKPFEPSAWKALYARATAFA